MLGSWAIFVAIGVVGTGLVGLVATQGGQKWLRKQRRRLLRKAVTDSKEAISAATPRAQLHAEKRQARKAQPRRLTVGHRRAPDDPTLTRRAARKAKAAARREVDKARVARANRQAAKRRSKRGLIEILTVQNESERARSQGLCGSTQTVDSHPCENLRMIGQRYCQVHVGNWIA